MLCKTGELLLFVDNSLGACGRHSMGTGDSSINQTREANMQ